MGVESDDTVRLRVPRRGGRGRQRPWLVKGGLVGGGLAACLAAGGLWWSYGSIVPAAPAPIAAPAVAQVALESTDEAKPDGQLSVRGRAQLAFAPTARPPSSPLSAPMLATEADILADAPDELAVYRFASQPAVVVLQFPSLSEQALALNRVAALIEKSNYPHDRVLPRAELNQRIIDSGATPDDFYYGHDYRSADLIKFFGLATDLNAQEQSLQLLIHKLGWDEKGAMGALVTLVRQTAGASALDPVARAAILRHELSHGVYFTNPDYAAYCVHFWRDVLTPDERAKFVSFLAREGYDTALTDLMINEAQAYLMHTPDRRFFSPTSLGLTLQRVAELRQIFLVSMPASWLRDSTSADKLP